MTDHRIDISVRGLVNEPVLWTVTCVCGWRSTARQQQDAEHQGILHRRVVSAMTVACDGCADVIPVRMIESVGSNMLCPECYDIGFSVKAALSNPAELIADLRALEQELRT